MGVWMIGYNCFVVFCVAFVDVHFVINVVRVMSVIDSGRTFVVLYFSGLVWLNLLIFADFEFKNVGVVYFTFAFRWIYDILQSIHPFSNSQNLLDSGHSSKISIALIPNTTANLIKASHIILFKRLQFESH